MHLREWIDVFTSSVFYGKHGNTITYQMFWTQCIIPISKGVLGFTTSESGLWTMAEALIVPVGCFTAGQYIRRTGYFKKFMFVIGALYVVGCGLSSQWMVRALPFFVGMFFVIIQGFSYGAILVSLFMSVASDLPGYGK